MTDASRRIRANSKRGRSGAGVRSGEKDTGASQKSPRTIPEDKSTPPMEIPRVLTRSVIERLTHGLDASDVLECYALFRSAPLHGIANSTLTVQKSTIGVRFRPTVADLKNPFNVKTPMELTLEYGPARLGPLLRDEATPIVQGNEESSSYLAWDNAGKVYFTQKIVTENFLSSHYMASMTGAVLNKLLTEAVDYTERRKVYQPFTVLSESGHPLLRSSSSSDFTWFVWTHLAMLGVEIEPILPPAMYETRIYTKSVTKVFPDQSVTHGAATFYQKFYDCLESIATNNYGSFLSSKEQSAIDDGDDNEDDDDDDDDSTSTTSSSTGTVAPTTKNGDSRYLGIESEDFSDLGNSRTDNINDQKRRRIDEEDQDAEEASEDVDKVTSENEEPQETEPQEEVEDQDAGEASEDVDDETSEEEESQETETEPPEEVEEEIDEEEIIFKISEANGKPTTIVVPDKETEDNSEAEATILPTDLPTSTGSLTLSPTDGIHDVEKAQNAANNAQKAADVAKIAANTDGGSKAADAAQAAADAALVAADATSSAASQAAMDSLLSGDGTLMSAIVATCFSNPRYGIAKPDANRTDPTEMYLFKDPSTYYKLELISPYLEVTKLNKPLPNAKALLSDYGAGGNALDWTLAIAILFSMFLMVLLVCQQTGQVYIKAIFRCQRCYFNREQDDEEEAINVVHSGSHSFFGMSSIPIGMVGKQPSYTVVKSGENFQNNVANGSSFMFSDGDSDSDGAEHDFGPISPSFLEGGDGLEMINFGSDAQNRSGSRRPRSRVGSLDSNSSTGSHGDRMLRNPDLVELPSLKSKSKVAIPVGMSPRGSLSPSRSSSYSDVIDLIDPDIL